MGVLVELGRTGPPDSDQLLQHVGGIADDGESLQATISNPSLGSVGAQDTGTIAINDGAGEALFFSDFGFQYNMPATYGLDVTLEF